MPNDAFGEKTEQNLLFSLICIRLGPLCTIKFDVWHGSNKHSSYSKRSTTILRFGKTKTSLTLMEGGLGLTLRRQNFPPTGTHPSPKFASVWRSTIRSILFKSPRALVPCIHLSPMDNTVLLHWVVTLGFHWLPLAPPSMTTVTRKGSTPSAPGQTAPKQESVFLVTMKTTVLHVTRGLGLVLAEKTTTPTHVETTLPAKT